MKVSEQPNFDKLAPLVGLPVVAGMLFEVPRRGVLTIWTADNGNEGWCVGDPPGSKGGHEGYTIFSGDCVDQVYNDTIVLS